MLRPARLTTNIRIGGGKLRGKHYLQVRCLEGRGWTRVAGGGAESALFEDGEVQQHLRVEWTAQDAAGWPLFMVELWRVSGDRDQATCEAVGAFPLPLLCGRRATQLSLFTAARPDHPPPPAESLLFPAANAHLALRCVCVLSLAVDSFAEDFDLQGAELRPMARAYK